MSTINVSNLKNPNSTSNNIVLAADGSTTITTLSSTTLTGTTIQGTIKSGTTVAATSGTSIDFTGIPSWVKKITIMLQGVSTNGTSVILVQVGDGSIVTSGYLGASASLADPNGVSVTLRTGGFGIDLAANAAAVRHGAMTITNITGNTWVNNAVIARSDITIMGIGSGSVALSGTLDRVRITTVNGTDTFDDGAINILYEG
jgi:hypothetical protein